MAQIIGHRRRGGEIEPRIGARAVPAAELRSCAKLLLDVGASERLAATAAQLRLAISRMRRSSA